ncbi:YolD-like family protein [Fictibacillus fluitans]|uniref:YolD-like family protein n=1 Tax=Fictibacillus fluitans TaxID=3058422 RepID=A0ABT8HUZ1_9BACL|nr:YolD-like family protein [Fictibacillus sp. NE201]MDN4524598.1 YolD-like family protein [Fictibacillus sp. NE201]
MNEVIRDRGNIKWKTSLMLPETVTHLKNYFLEEYYKEEELEMDEQHLQEMDQLMLEAMEFSYALRFDVYQNGHMVNVKGKIHYMDEKQRILRVMDEDDQLHILRIPAIKDISKAEE